MTIKNSTKPAQKRRIVSFTLLTLVSNFSVVALPTTPNAGSIQNDLRFSRTKELPIASSVLNLQAPAVTQYDSGGPVITLRTISFTGNIQYTSAALSAVLADAIGKTYDYAGLQDLTNNITMYYRDHGFTFARALLPVQTMTDGHLVIQVIEGLYGSIKATGDDKHAARAQVFLSKLQAGEVIRNASLERATLILADQPGFITTPLLRPGEKVATADLYMDVVRDKRYSVELGLDNYGNRYTGRNRAHLYLDVNSPFLFGDQLQLDMLYSQENLWMARLNYSLPLGGSGLRANAGYEHVYYELGKEFANSQVYGTAQVISTGLSYPIIRSQQADLSISVTYQHKILNSSDDITPSSNTNSSDSLPINFSFSYRDQLVGGGITYGAVSWTHGYLTLASGNRASDSITAKTAGSFNKINLDLVRLQALPFNFGLFGRVSAQWAGKNLDSSEVFALGGVNSVRAYPSVVKLMVMKVC